MGESICMVTGATGGIGLVTAREIARQGATVVVVGRSPERSRAAVDQISEQTGNSRVDFLLADLSIQEDIRRLVDEFKARYARLHVLVNNAGGLFLNGQVAPDGIDMTLAAQPSRPLPADPAAARSPRGQRTGSHRKRGSSVAHVGERIDFTNLQFGGWRGYQRSKLANILFTYELARRLEGTGVTVNALHPGLVDSGFGRNNRGLFSLIRPLVYGLALNNDQGARTSVYLACSPEVEGVTGRYFARCRPRRSSRASYDRASAVRLWERSAAMTGLLVD